jgi:hypothetical protein
LKIKGLLAAEELAIEQSTAEAKKSINNSVIESAQGIIIYWQV